MKKQKIAVVNNGVGKNEIINEYIKLNNFILREFDVLYAGAVRLGLEIEADYYAPRRINYIHGEGGFTKIHEVTGLKIVNGWHVHDDHMDKLTAEQLLNSCKLVQRLLEAAKKDVKCSFEIEIIEK